MILYTMSLNAKHPIFKGFDLGDFNLNNILYVTLTQKLSHFSTIVGCFAIIIRDNVHIMFGLTWGRTENATAVIVKLFTRV